MRSRSLPLPQPWGPASMPQHWQRGHLSSKAPATHPTPSSQGPQASEAAVSGSGPDRHCQPPVLAVGTSSTSPPQGRALASQPRTICPPHLSGPAPSGPPSPLSSAHTQVTGPGRWPPWERLDAALSPFQPSSHASAHRYHPHPGCWFLATWWGETSPSLLERRKPSVQERDSGAGLLSLGQSVCSEI